MLWYTQWSDAIKKRACRYLLQRYLGQYLKEKLTLDQLSVDLYNGTGTITDLNLDVDALNEMADTYNLPIEFIDGYIQSISVTIPWSSLLHENSFVEVQGLMMTIKPRQRSGSASVMNSILGSMTTSMQLAQECLRQEEQDNDRELETARPVEGLEKFAQTIDSVLCRIKVRFLNTTIRLEHVPKGSRTGVALEISIKVIDYFDEAGTESSSLNEQRSIYEPAAFTCKNLHWEGVAIFTDEFPSSARTFSKSVYSMSSSPDGKANIESFTTAPDTPELGPEQSIFESCITSNGGSGNGGNNTALNLSTQPDPILIAKLSGRHQIRVKLKQCESIAGPKVFMDFTFGSVVLFLSPRQVHILAELLGGLVSPDPEDDSSLSRRYRSTNKPMQASDFERVEQELQKHLSPQCQGRSLQHQQGWSSQSLEDSDDEFLPVDGTSGHRMAASTASDSSAHLSDGGESVMNSSFGGTKRSSSIGSEDSHPRHPHHEKPSRRQATQSSIHFLVDDPMAELTHIKLQLSSLVVIVIHDDVLTTAVSGSGLVAQSSVQQMKSQAEKFFNDLGVFTLGGCAERDLASSHERLSSVCKVNHLRFIGAPCTLEGVDQTSSLHKSISATLSFGVAELAECLFDKKSPPSQPVVEYSTLLGFPREKTGNKNNTSPNFLAAALAQPCLRMKINYLERLVSQSSRARSVGPPKIEIQIQLAPCVSEVDITIVDRISCLLNPQELCGRTPSPPSVQTTNQGYNISQAIEEGTSNVGHKLDFSIVSPLATLKFRFPVPDLRPLHDMDRIPWWRKTIRKDTLLLELTDARFHTALEEADTHWSLDFRCRELHALFQEGSNDPPISFLRASPGNGDEECSAQADEGDELDWPRLNIKIRSPTPATILEEQEQEDSDGSTPKNSIDTLVNQLCAADTPEPSPFSSRKIIYESNHLNRNNVDDKKRSDNSPEGEQMVLPGERTEVAEFIEHTTSNCQYVVELNLANLNVFLPSKHFYEVLYNRISTDLLLWEPAAPRPATKDATNVNINPGSLDLANRSIMQDTVYQTFSACKSALQYDSSSESEEENPSYFSFYDHKQRQQKNTRMSTTGTSTGIRQNKVCFTVTSKQAAFTLQTPLRDSNQKVVPEHRGEVHLQLVDSTFFAVATPKGSPTAGFMCLHANRTSVFHKGVLSSFPPNSMEPFVVRTTDLSAPKHLYETLYRSDEGTCTKLSGLVGKGDDTLDMLLLAIRINLDKARNVKTFRVALGIRGATLLHRVCPTTESCFSQFIDFFDVVDYPVMGYKPPEVITELHLHTWGCAVDYRPLYLPVRSLITMETFSVCSNIAAQTSSSVVRIIIEDAGLFLSKKLEAPTVDLKKDYVCVVDMGFFELSLRCSDGKDQKQPKVDLRASNNILHIRTCVDSCRALQELLCYFANDGDLKDGLGDDQVIAEDSFPNSLQSDLSTLTNVEEEHVHTLMAEAMKESTCNSGASSSEDDHSPPETQHGLSSDVFLFPDQVRHPPKPKSSPSSNILSTDLTDDLTEDSSGGSFDDDFCILENDPGVGILPRTGEPQIRALTTEPIRLVENHFSVPLGRMDQLKAPKHFPHPILRYTLREISLVWHLYGGQDFSEKQYPQHADSGKGFDTRSRKESDLESEYGWSDYGEGRTTSPRDVENMGVAFSKANSGEVRWTKPSPMSSGRTIRRQSSSASQQTLQSRGGPGRQHDVLMELQMNKVRFQHEMYPESAPQASRQILLVHDVEIRDRLASSQINKFLYQYSSESMPRQSHANMVVIKVLHVRPDPSIPMQECALKVSILPLRLNIDQDALFFLYNFFNSLSSAGSGEDATGACPNLDSPLLSGGSPAGSGPSSIDSVKGSPGVTRASSVLHPVPVMTVASAAHPTSPNSPTLGAITESHNLITFDEKAKSSEGQISSGCQQPPDPVESPSISSPIFFRSFVFSPDVPIRLDYHGKRVDMEQGALAGLIIGLGQLNCSELRLKRLSYRHGLLGMDRLFNYILGEWLQDIKQTQLPSLLGGVGPLHSLVQLFQGVRDLFWLPIEQYRKDGRIVRGLQRGANAFTTSTAMAALELTNRLVQAVQCTAETAYDVVSPGPSVRNRKRGVSGQHHRKRPSQPADIREGMTNAYHVVRDGLGDTARTLVQVASEEHEHKGISGAVGGVLRQIPSTVVKPIILATEATSNVLGGMRHQLAPDVRREAAEKWRTED